MKLFTVCLLVLPLLTRGQGGAFSFQYDQRPAMSMGGRTVRNPWAGGLNATQYSTMRLNDDAREDLVVFDRTANKVSTFVAVDSANGTMAWQYAPQYEGAFAQPILNNYNWLLLADYDGDGKKDVFASYVGGARAYRNVSTAGQVQFQLVSDRIMALGFSGLIPLFVAPTDVPAFVDYDDDGDIDVLTYSAAGDHVVYYQNFSVERTGKPGLDLQQANPYCWGQFSKQLCNDFTFYADCTPTPGSVPTPAKPRGARTMHTGNTTAVFDTDGDGKKDLLFGFVTCPNIARVYNNVSRNDSTAKFTAFDTLFPRQNPIQFPAFPAVFFADADGDGVTDLLASPNVSSNDNNAFDFRASGWLYKNVGTNQKPNFQLARKDFLQNDMLDLGENAAPALADLDGDGDADLLVGYAGAQTSAGYRAGLYQFENRGTAQNPAFVLVTTDYLGLSSLVLTNVLPQLIDVDGNGSTDLVLTGTGGRGIEMRVLFNGAGRGAAVQYSAAGAVRWPTPDLMGPGDLPTVADVDGDGRPDVLIGKNDGTIQYVRNTGTARSPLFQLQNQNFGGDTYNTAVRARSLVVADLNGDHKNELLTAAYYGQMRVYQFPDKPDQPLTLLDSLPTLGMPGNHLVGAVADLDGDGLPDWLLGTGGGGLRYLRNTSPKVIVTGLPAEPTGPWAFPNPTDRFLTINPPYDGRLDLLAPTGRSVWTGPTVRTGVETGVDLGHLAGGTYLLRLLADSRPPLVLKVVVWR